MRHGPGGYCIRQCAKGIKACKGAPVTKDPQNGWHPRLTCRRADAQAWLRRGGDGLHPILRHFQRIHVDAHGPAEETALGLRGRQ